MRSLRSWSVLLVLVAWICPPGWEDDTDFTHQTWDFITNDVPLVADAGYSNPFGDPTFTDVYLCNPDYMFWDPDAMGFAIGRYGLWGGMPFGAVGPDEVAVALTFQIPNQARPSPWYKEVWVQVAYWGSISAVGRVLKVEIASDPNFQNVYLTYVADDPDIEDQSETGAGSTGQFWRFTHTFELPEQPGVEYVRVSLVTADSLAVFVDQVSIDTRCRQPGIPGDFDEDQDVDLADFAYFQNCFAGGGVPSPACAAADLDDDENVGLGDAALMVANFTGPGS